MMVMGGGYGHRIEETVQVQCNSYRLAFGHWSQWQIDHAALQR